MSVHGIRSGKRPERNEPPIIDGRPPPHDLNAEAAVIAACLVRTELSSSSIIDRVIGVLGDLGPLAFYNELSSKVWQAIVDVHTLGSGVDTVTVTSRMRDAGTWSEAIARHLDDIDRQQPALIDRMVVDHAKIIVEKARMRRVIATFQEWAARGYGDVPSSAEFMRDASAFVSRAAREVGAVEDSRAAGEAEESLRAELAERRVSIEQGNTAGYPTGITGLDAITGGLFARGVHFISGPEKGRKSTVAMWAAVSTAESSERVLRDGEITSQRRGVVVFPFEMSSSEVQLVTSCQRGGVDSSLFTKGGATPADYAARERGAAHFIHLPIVFDDRPGLSIETLRPRLREAKAKLERGLPGRRRMRADGTWELLPALAPAPLRLVVIDTFQLFAKQTPHRPQDLQSITDAAGAEIKTMAGKEHEWARVSWLLISHENAQGDLRDSGALKNHLTQWIKLEVDPEETSPYDPNLMVARFKVHRWRHGAAGGMATAWLHAKTGAIS